MNHIEIMETYQTILDELERKSIFRKNMETTLQSYEFHTFRNILEIEEKTDIVLKNNIVDIASKSMKKTDLYFFLEQSNTEAIISLVESDNFKYELYYINQYTNLLKDIVNKYWNPHQKAEELIALVIKKGMEKDHNKTKEVCTDIKLWYENWKEFIDKQILYYKLEDKIVKKTISKKIKNKKI